MPLPEAAPRRRVARRWLKPLVFAACLVPLAALARAFSRDRLGANPIEAVEIETGVWTLRFLVLTLAITPARRLFGWNGLAKYRRMIGLFVFFYATVHLSIYVGLDMTLDVGDIVHDVIKHKYITVGMAAWLLLLPLAITSTKGWVRRLGGKRWQALHRAIYAIAILGTVHYLWGVKKDIQRPLLYAAVFAILLGYRLWLRVERSVTTRERTATVPQVAAE